MMHPICKINFAKQNYLCFDCYFLISPLRARKSDSYIGNNMYKTDTQILANAHTKVLTQKSSLTVETIQMIKLHVGQVEIFISLFKFVYKYTDLLSCQRDYYRKVELAITKWEGIENSPILRRSKKKIILYQIFVCIKSYLLY